ncbi:hypothetical protein P9K38_02295 [Pseudomonas sp. 905_Psudmo1]|nr:hypothetical protein [Pseudomonas sp. 905_Psudmo1]WFS19187.1 hypothetical protein P9K38_02295 [Pseudomonas sp. 905_Psudmo1]
MQDMRFTKRITPLLTIAMLVGCGENADKQVAKAGAVSEEAVAAPAEVTQVEAAASGGSAACLDAPTLRTIGNTWTITTDGQRDVNTVAELADYRGQSAYRTHTENSVGTVADAYGNVVDGLVHWYGSVMTQPAVNESYNQPSFSVPVDLPQDQTHSVSFDSITVQPEAEPFVMKLTNTVTYRGRERIETEFGAFDTCKIEFSTEGAMVPKTTWQQWIIASGKFAGLPLRMSNAQGTTQASSIEVSW